ncbi:MAG: hypothetical protein QM731_22390 [Chitinophagaceae bacterium]
MKQHPFFQWIPVLLVLMLITAGIGLKQRNNYLHKKNNELLLQNDSILSVNLQLERQMTEMKKKLDSMSKLRKPARFQVSTVSYSRR